MFGGARPFVAALLVIALGLPIGVAEAQSTPSAAGPCADPCQLPDGRIRLRSEAVAIGDGIYNWDGLGQTRVALVPREGRARFVVRAENDGNGIDDLVVQGTRNTTNFGIRYFVGDQEVSARVRNGSFRFADVGPGQHRALNVDVRANPAAPLRSKVIVRVVLRSGTDGTLRDRVKAVVYRSQGVETLIEGRPFTGQATAERWADDQGASARFVLNAALYWELGPARGIRPEVAYAQSAKETAYGHFGGVIDASFHNPCGLKTTTGGDNDDPNAHMRFVNWRQGITACIDHLGLYAGAPGYPRASTPDPRHFTSIYATAPTVERLGGHWAPDPDYGRSIVRDYLNPLLGS